MSGLFKTQAPNDTEYAQAEDFCALFARESEPLYSLALLLTAEHDAAERIFVSALDSCLASRPVFKPWVRTWAKRAIMIKSIESLTPKSTEALSKAQRNGTLTTTIHDAAMSAVVSLPVLERFVFVMNVLERLSAAETAALLGITRKEVPEIRMRAMSQIAGTEFEGRLSFNELVTVAATA